LVREAPERLRTSPMRNRRDWNERALVPA